MEPQPPGPTEGRGLLLVALLVGLVGVVVAAALFDFRAGRQPRPPAQAQERQLHGGGVPSEVEMPDFALRDHEGRRLDSGQLAGKVTLVTFLDTECTEACPLIARRLVRAMDELEPDARRRVAAVAISVDPAGDSPAAVREFLRRHRAVGAMRYLIGTLGELEPVWRAFHVLPSAETGDSDLHSAPVRLYDQAGRWVASFHVGADLTPATLVHDLRVLLGASTARAGASAQAMP